ncbi:condensation domain-containing protein, partial [Bacteroides ovatus]|uniref:condensation domain-containing protein n=1 Tax=Bacteroides ovatus TaxID=28116 RepID=UPI001C704A44
YHALNQGDIDDAYQVQLVWEYNCTIHVEHLKTAWEYAQRKFPSLRLGLLWEEDLVQVIYKESNLNWIYMDISIYEAEERETILKRIVREDKAAGFDLRENSLFRVHLVKLSDNRYCCIFNSHHAILDGWSNPILFTYIHDVYRSLM